jgi:hypothetical protein
MARDGGRRKRPAPAPTGAATGVGTAERPRPPAGLLRPDDVLELQRTAGNRAVSDAISVQRAGPGTGTVAPARQQLDRALSSMDFVAIAAVKDFSLATDPERLTMLRALATVHKMGRLESGATKRIWQSFGNRLAVVASEQSALWDLCQSKGAKLPTSWLGAGQGSRKFDFTEQVGGNVFVGTGAYEYRVKADAIVVTVGMNFKPDRGVTVPTNTWFGYITSTWNRFSAVNQADPTRKKHIDFQPVAGRGHEIQVSAGTGRANAGHYYVGDSRAPTSIPHEFGHLIGLEDEYERDRADYERVTGERVPAGSGDVAGATTIARQLREALYKKEKFFEWHTTAVRRRMAAVNRVLAAHHIVVNYQRGRSPITHEIAAQYKNMFGVELSADVMKKVDKGGTEFSDWRERFLGTFQYTSTSIMGDMSDHTHPVAARHVRAFSDFVQRLLGGRWTPKEER